MRVDVLIDRSLPASPERVFQALTSPDDLLVWWWPWQPTVEVDAHPGGRYRFTTVHPRAGAMAVGGVYREVAAPGRLEYTWRWEGDELETVVTISLAGRGDRTELSLCHAGWPTEAARDDHVRGWSDCLDRLEAHLGGG